MVDWLKNTFEPELLEEILRYREQSFDPEEILLSEGAYINQVPLLLSGSVKVRKRDESGKEIVLYHIRPGESCVLSITSCLTMKQSKAEAIVEGESNMILLGADKVREWMDRYKSWRGFVQGLYYKRLDVLLGLVDAIAFKQVDERLLEKLRELRGIHGEMIPVTHQQIATEIGTAREVISRLLKQLENQGKIKLDRGNIQIIGPV
jgi:CRP/FNR family transcriptional regulator